ncbi:5'-methylthioadenosine/S-adenosylhomocysteine nucleosidase [Actinotignum urinale]|uniref:adenosylhomocysteine nucleosidase n=1 Tax=Actinotignum urinale TaxID=190146 RepID=A0AAW9HYR9_9ACTO|nr:5'-methylthioadenosine/S-adenosylhomocysteine nucleosidase [Actinotignum urinale]MDY5128470.1 5'-methylthioadenosine/S-adenosylhomocysteine nucleosidase [Actinotignum urinale]MDY5151216.1 5'-methylthioadenosine/S-adenosylhomocysteine nucleosidase [Actinotignum urinale]MDY5155164.1 5'-methylthioadenosine/S-adenosylhomocysteine nucleosidase [Actinotignum urinale]
MAIPRNLKIRGIVIAAQDAEITPVIHILASLPRKNIDDSTTCIPLPRKDYTTLSPVPSPFGEAVTVETPWGKILCIRTGIGLVNTAGLIGWLTTVFTPQFIISAGTAGGLSSDVAVGDIIVGNEYAYGRADATAFGYEPGQVPGNPVTFPASPELLELTPDYTRTGTILSSDAFVTAKNVGETRALFPAALATDMESAAAAHICYQLGIPFVSIRCISDLCSPDGAEVYHMELASASELSAKAVVKTISAWAQKYRDKKVEKKEHSRPRHGMRQRFTEESLQAGLLYVYGRVNNVTGDGTKLSHTTIKKVREQLVDSVLDAQTVLNVIQGGKELLAKHDDVTLTAKVYDEERSKIAAAFGDVSGRGKLHWPPTSQTVIKRFNGYWNNALESVGFATQSGRRRGMLKFTEEDYLDTVKEYILHCDNLHVNTSYNGYVEWVRDESRAGKVPSGPSIRQRYGSWLNALDIAMENMQAEASAK